MWLRGEESDCVEASLDPAPAPGSVADREHRKWEEKAVPLSHNPYSSENIGRRRSLPAGEESIVSLR